MGVDGLISAMITRGKSADLREHHSFKITEEEFLNEVPARIVQNGLRQYAEEWLYEYMPLTERFTMLPTITSFACEGVIGYIMSGMGEGRPSAILHVINPKEILASDLLGGPFSKSRSPISSLGDGSETNKTATIGGWQRSTEGRFEHMGRTGGEFHDKDGKYVKWDFEISVSNLLPVGESNPTTDAANIVPDMGNYCCTLGKDEEEDTAMQAEP
ncbi:hypothetical protein LTR17_002175 [Elasticomyces elasticus]|nr:hypothetical protein LTR17_002175 [Elasticomyces elasticus]